MYLSSSLALAGLAGLTGLAAASPINHLRDSTSPFTPLTVPRDVSPPLLTRQQAGDANVDVDISKSEIRWGNQPPWDVIHKMHDECDVSGCSSQFEHKTTVVYSSLDKKEISLTIDTGPSHYDDWIKRGLVDLLVWMLKQEDVVRIEREQPWNAPCMGFQCQGTKTEFHDQYYATRRMQAEYTHGDGHKSIMQFDVRDNEDEVRKEACQKSWEGAGTFGGYIHEFGSFISAFAFTCSD